MRFITITLIVHAPDPHTGAAKSTPDRFREVLGNAVLAEQGNGAAQRDLFHVTPGDQWDRNAESYEVFRRLWRDNKITYETRFRPPLTEAEVWPRPLQRPPWGWGGGPLRDDAVPARVVAAAGSVTGLASG